MPRSLCLLRFPAGGLSCLISIYEITAHPSIAETGIFKTGRKPASSLLRKNCQQNFLW